MPGSQTTTTLAPKELPRHTEEHAWCWCGVILFHPDAARMGACAYWAGKSSSFSIGRREPEFRREEGAGWTLEERTVSRHALTMERQGSAWELSRTTGSSRVRVDGEELGASLTLAGERARDGVVVILGDRVVLHLRYRPERVEDAGVVQAEERSRLLARLPGVSLAARRLRREVARAAASDGDVLLLGPTGTGKERVARAIHELTGDGRPWVAVNVAALPPDIAAASLFGARKGAYTGADAHRQGYFRQADGGTLFLDEIGDAPLSLQPQLLRALQEREIQVLGGPTERVSLRVVAATEHDPDQHPESLRPALRYRLGANELRLPELRQRREDLGLLALAMFAELGRSGGPWESSSGEALALWARCFEALAMHDWPGNLRELHHVLTQLLAQPLRPRLGPRFGRRPAPPSIAEPAPAAQRPQAVVRLQDVDDSLFLKAWKNAGHEPAALARALGVSRASVYRRVQRTPACRLAADIPLAELLVALDECHGDLEATAQKLEVSRRGLATRLRVGGVSVPAPDDDDGARD